MLQENGRVHVKELADNKLELFINELTPADTGDYECKAHNEGGHTSATARVVVQCELNSLCFQRM